MDIKVGHKYKRVKVHPEAIQEKSFVGQLVTVCSLDGIWVIFNKQLKDGSWQKRVTVTNNMFIAHFVPAVTTLENK